MQKQKFRNDSFHDAQADETKDDMMSTFEPAALFLRTADLLGASQFESDVEGCSFEYKSNSFSLSFCQGPVGNYVIGQMKLQDIRPEQNAKQVLLAMYLNCALFRLAQFPVWYAVDPVKDVLGLMFCLNSADVSPESIARVIEDTSSLPTNGDFASLTA